MRDNRFLLTRILRYKNNICYSFLIRDNMEQLKPVFSHILGSVTQLTKEKIDQTYLKIKFNKQEQFGISSITEDVS